MQQYFITFGNALLISCIFMYFILFRIFETLNELDVYCIP